jgi:hypothetical protein
MERDKGQGRPEGTPKKEDRAPQKEQGRRHKENAERQPLPNVWDVLEQRVRLHEELSAGRIFGEEYKREQIKLNRTCYEIEKKGSDRDKLIIKLHGCITYEPTGTLLLPLKERNMSPEEFQQFRSKVEPLADEELAEKVRTAEEDYERKRNETPFRGPWPSGGINV